MTPQRTLVIDVPDWPIVALARAGDEIAAAGGPVAVFDRGVVSACSPAARAEGVRPGQRRRDAQSRCPHVHVVDADPARDQRLYAPLLARIEELSPRVDPLRPGRCALHARGPARYYGGEGQAAAVLLDALAGDGVGHARAGVADGLFTAVQAAAVADPVRIVPPGASGPFLAPLPVSVLLDGAVEHAAVDLFARLGVQTLGQLAQLPPDRLAERFGPRGLRLHALAAGRDAQPVTARTPPPELHREVAFEPPLELADQVGFGVRVAADELIAGLGALDLVCTRLRVVLTGTRGEVSDRVWLHPASFDAAAVVDRVRWQLAEQRLSSAVAHVRLDPDGVDDAAHHVAVLFGSGPEERVHHALSRVQAMLGHREVLTVELGGGRWLGERQRLVPWSDRAAPDPAAAHPWPGTLPDPLPATVFTAPAPVAVVDAEGDMVAVDARGEITATPAALVAAGRPRAIRGWAGPWPVVERGWDPTRARRAHRFQVVDADETAWLLVCEDAVWHAEGRYD